MEEGQLPRRRCIINCCQSSSGTNQRGPGSIVAFSFTMSEKSNHDQQGAGLTSLVESAQASHESINAKPPPPADRGKDAYLFLASCCVLEAVVWGASQLFLLRLPVV